MKKTLIVVDMQNDFIDMALGTPEANVKVDKNCCAGVTVESHNSALKTMEMC